MRTPTMLSASMLAAVALLVVAPVYGGDNGVEKKAKAKSTTQEVKTAITDSWLTAKTKIALYADDRVKGTQVNVDATHGVVTLRGKVDSEEAKNAAAETAKGIEGVKNVKNDLEVVAPSERKMVEASDKEITGQVTERFSKDAHLKTVRVRTDAKVVTLTGKVPSIAVSAYGSEMARAVPGVRAVRNELSIAPTSRTSTSWSESTIGHSGEVTVSYREHVKATQEVLKAKGHDPGPIDGIMGPQTASALGEFQKAQGLHVTRRLDAITQARLARHVAM